MLVGGLGVTEERRRPKRVIYIYIYICICIYVYIIRIYIYICIYIYIYILIIYIYIYIYIHYILYYTVIGPCGARVRLNACSAECVVCRATRKGDLEASAMS